MITRRQLLVGGTAALAVTAMRSQAWSWSPPVEKAVAAPPPSPLDEILGESRAIRALRDTAHETLARLAGFQRLPPILIVGESGSGKQLLANAMHRAGPRSGRPFLTVSVSAIPESLLEVELFGFERNAFRGTRVGKLGLFHVAHEGTLVLEEAAVLSPSFLGGIAAAIEDGTVRRMGGTRVEPVDVWVIATSSLPLDGHRGGSSFSEIFRPLVVLTVPPLRERDDDVVLLADHFLTRHCEAYGIAAKTLSPNARSALREHSWPGHVRELSNVMERAVIMSETDRIEPEDLPANGTASNQDFRHLTRTHLRAGLVRPCRRRRTR